MKQSNDIENEIDAIRDKLYAKIKNMTSSERVTFINARDRKIMNRDSVVMEAGSGVGGKAQAGGTEGRFTLG